MSVRTHEVNIRNNIYDEYRDNLFPVINFISSILLEKYQLNDLIFINGLSLVIENKLRYINLRDIKRSHEVREDGFYNEYTYTFFGNKDYPEFIEYTCKSVFNPDTKEEIKDCFLFTPSRTLSCKAKYINDEHPVYEDASGMDGVPETALIDYLLYLDVLFTNLNMGNISCDKDNYPDKTILKAEIRKKILDLIYTITDEPSRASVDPILEDIYQILVSFLNNKDNVKLEFIETSQDDVGDIYHRYTSNDDTITLTLSRRDEFNISTPDKKIFYQDKVLNVEIDKMLSSYESEDISTLATGIYNNLESFLFIIRTGIYK